MNGGGYFAVSQCYGCGTVFSFNPELVPSLPIDPDTNLPLDVDTRGQTRQIDPDALGRAIRQPLCADCVELANAARRARGAPLITVLPGAYELTEGLPS